MPRTGDFRVVIPARYGSTRLPGKVLRELAGKPVLQHVYERASASSAREVLIATDDERVAATGAGFGARVLMTSPAHRSGTDRLAEVADLLDLDAGDVLVNCQGDAPLVAPGSLDQVAGLLSANPDVDLATLCTPIRETAEYLSRNVVKVVRDQAGRALYFSRAPIPAVGHGHDAETRCPPAWRHLGLYGYRAGALRRLAATPACALEEIERLEQLRALWCGLRIAVAEAEHPAGPDVDTAEDLARVEALLYTDRGEH